MIMILSDMPDATIGWSETSSNAPVGMLLAKPTLKMVAVSISMAIARVFRR